MYKYLFLIVRKKYNLPYSTFYLPPPTVWNCLQRFKCWSRFLPKSKQFSSIICSELIHVIPKLLIFNSQEKKASKSRCGLVNKPDMMSCSTMMTSLLPTFFCWPNIVLCITCLCFIRGCVYINFQKYFLSFVFFFLNC